MFMQRVSGIVMLGLAVAAFVGGSSSAKAQDMSMSDKHFMKNAAEGGLAEVELGQLAQEKASDPEVKKFGERMVTDHTKANEKLKALAQSKKVELPTSLAMTDKATKMRLEHLSGADFDKAYMEDMVKDHTSDVSDFEKESGKAQDPDLKSFVNETLPTLKEHLRKAKEIQPKTTAQR